MKLKLIMMRKIARKRNSGTFIMLALVCTGVNPLKLPPLYLAGQTRVRASPARHLRCKLCNMCARTNMCTLRAQTCVYRARTYVCATCAHGAIRDHAASCGTKCIRRTLAPPPYCHQDCPQLSLFPESRVQTDRKKLPFRVLRSKTSLIAEQFRPKVPANNSNFHLGPKHARLP